MAQSPTPQHVRPKRFPLRLPVLYRRTGRSPWYPGTSENISCCGVLFRGRHRLEPRSEIEVRVPLPQELSGEGTITMLCRGYVARTVEPRFPFSRVSLAAAFTNYRLERTDAQQPAPAVDQQAKSLSHRLNELLAVILGNADLILGSENLAPEIRKRMMKITEASERAAIVVRELLESKGGDRLT